MYFRSAALLFSICLMGATANGQSLVTKADRCLGVDPIYHDDGRYTFNRESWRRLRANRHYYGRCIEVVEPTTKLKNTWIGVLPPGSIARLDRPTISGQEFDEEKTTDAISDLFYGNSDDRISASYLAHEYEVLARSNEDGKASHSKSVASALDELGQLVTESIFQTSFLINVNDDQSIADFNFHLRSTLEGSATQYLASYDFLVESSDYQETILFVRFTDDFLSDLLLSSTDRERLELEIGGADFELSWLETVNPGFARSSAELVNSDGTVLLSLPIGYYKSSE